jgi:ubiquinone/menaquinone biosynthesis C-methylase UbiE
MRADTARIAETFDARAGKYAQNEWHRRCAERLIGLCRLQSGDRVLDAGTGTGFAALAAARAVGVHGRVIGVDISPGMLREARVAVEESGLTNIELIEADAVCLPQAAESVDVITCAAALLYMPVAEALREWYRVLEKGGRVAFSTMHAGSPPAGRIFRECAATFGTSLRDPSEPLGSASASRQALEDAGLEVVDIVSETIEFTPQDLSLAWESNFRSAGHADVQRLTDEQQRAFKSMYLDALALEESENPGALNRADLLYVLGRRPARAA